MNCIELWLAPTDEAWTAGCQNGAELWWRPKSEDFKGSLRVVTEWATRRRRTEARPYCGLRKGPSASMIARMTKIIRDALWKNDAVTISRLTPPFRRSSRHASCSIAFKQ